MSYTHNGAYTHNGDRDLMLYLGLRVEGFGRDWTDLGTVEVESVGHMATARVEVSAMPAQFWRFTLERPADVADGSGAPPEQAVLTTGSGAFRTYWPVAVMWLQHAMDLEQADA